MMKVEAFLYILDSSLMKVARTGAAEETRSKSRAKTRTTSFRTSPAGKLMGASRTLRCWPERELSARFGYIILPGPLAHRRLEVRRHPVREGLERFEVLLPGRPDDPLG